MTEAVRRFDDSASLAQQVALDVTTRLLEAQAHGRVPSLVLTGGTISREVHRAMADLTTDLEWSRLDVWWGDERFLPSGDPERNATQAREDLLDHVPVHPARVHELPATDSGQGDAASAASAYAHLLRRALESRNPGEPWFDVVMLGIGPDGHCASLFPGRPEVLAGGYVVPVHNAPKPPPTRLSLTLPVLRQGCHVVFMATGAEKAEAVAASVRGTDVEATPAAGPRGLATTAWYLDEAAAGQL